MSKATLAQSQARLYVERGLRFPLPAEYWLAVSPNPICRGKNRLKVSYTRTHLADC